MGIQLTKQTAQKLKALLRSPVRATPLDTKGKGTERYDVHVLITGDEVDGYFPCVPTYYDPELADWVEFETQAAKRANDDIDLVIGNRYRAICYGQTTIDDVDYLVFAAGEPCCSPALACGLYYDEITGELTFDYEEVAGQGLEVDYDDCDSASGSTSSSSGDICCPKLKVKEHCHIKVDDDGVKVDTETLAGLGLKEEDESADCTALAIDDEVEDGPTITTLTDVYPNDCGYCYVFVTYTIQINPAGVFMGLTSTEETICDECSSDSDSDSDSDSGDCFDFLSDVQVSCVDGEITVTKTYSTACWTPTGFIIT